MGIEQRRLEALKEVLEAFNRHDLDAIMSHLADDCVFESPRGPDAWGRRFVGKEEVREGLAARFEGIPDVHYADDAHFVCGKRGVSEWTISGTTLEGERIEVRGCDLWTFGDDERVTRKDSFWKIREPRAMDEEVVPVLFVEDAARAVAWYGRLGFVQEWEHQFEPGFPWFVSVARGNARLYLSEHEGDARPDTLIHLYVKDIDAVSEEFGIPVDEEGLAGRECDLVDPDGNRLRVATRRS